MSTTSADSPKSLKQRALGVLPAALIVVGLTGFVFAFTIGSGDDDANLHPAIEERFPAEGSEVLRQAQVGIDLESGYEAQLYLNEIPIPLDEVNVLRSADDPERDLPTTDQINSLSRFVFQPGPGRTIETLDADRNCVRAEFWPEANPEEINTTQWCFTAA